MRVNFHTFRTFLAQLLSLPLVLGCSGEPATQGEDGPAMTNADMAKPASDDGPVVEPDLSMASPDLATPAIVVEDLPSCGNDPVNAQKLWDGTVKGRCATDKCHGTVDPKRFGLSGPADLAAKWVEKFGSDTMKVPYVRSGKINESYVMFKLANQQAKVGGKGLMMPRDPQSPTGATRLTDPELCLFMGWISQGTK